MFIGIGGTIPEIANLPGPSRPGWPSGSDERLITKWRTTTPNEDITLWGGGTAQAPTARLNDMYNYEVDWGDGTTEIVVGVRNKTHTYVSAGDHEVKITGQFAGFQFLNATSAAERDKIIELKNWGISKLWGLQYAFYYCSNLDVTAKDAPQFDGVGNLARTSTDCISAFTNCNVINFDLSRWDLNWVSRFYQFLYNNRNVESITMPDINGTAYDHSTMFGYVGIDNPSGATLTWNNYTNTRGGGVAMGALFGYGAWQNVTCNDWSIVQINSLSYSFGVWADIPDCTLTLKNWSVNSGGSGILSMSSTFRGQTAYIVDTTGWAPEMTQNCTSWSHLAYGSTRWKEWKGLSDISLNSVTSTINAFYNCGYFQFKSGGSNFSDNCATSGSLTSTQGMFGYCGYGLTSVTLPGTEAPNVRHWNMTNCTNISSMFLGHRGSDEMPFVDLWDLSSLVSINSFAYVAGLTNYTKPWYIDWSNSNLGPVTTFGNFSRGGPVQSLDLTGQTLSSVTSFSHAWYAPITTDGGDNNDFRFIIDSSTDLSSVNYAVNWMALGKFRTADYDQILTRLKATNTTTATTMYIGGYFTGDLVWPNALTATMTGYSVTTEVTDTNADFVTAGVTAGDIVFTKSGSSYKWAEVVSVDSATKLTINAAIVSSAYRYYNVCKSQVAKDKYHLIANQSWTISDSGPVII